VVGQATERENRAGRATGETGDRGDRLAQRVVVRGKVDVVGGDPHPGGRVVGVDRRWVEAGDPDEEQQAGDERRRTGWRDAG
jgi:hypothetical protein